ncbi:carnitine O-acetyltransferase-like [Enoplosus armatus]|uniref:carnitine O-acetyltransferase-like n=1 Tax=Enoplosus armatus TaxID=215367 RepID=UPI00399515DA
MLTLCSRALVKLGMVMPCHLVKPVSATLVAGRNMTQQKGLPSLPVPCLQQTCELYLSFLEPLLEVDELKRAKELVEEFQKAGGVGERLQRGMERKARNTENWLTDFYVRNIYFDQRKPLVIHSNIGALFPQMDFRDKQEHIRYAAELLAAFLDVKTMIDNETLPAEYMRGKPLCMKQYEQLLSSCRIPGLKTDSLVFYAKSSTPPKHVTVICNNQFFVLDVYNSDGNPLTVDQLYVQLEWICNSSLQTNMEPVGILTTQHRDIWSKTYSNFIKDETNKESVSAIQSSICTVCLDEAMPPVSDEMFRSSAILKILHGGGSQCNSGNRWFDKGMQIIIGEDGICGVNVSHAAGDGSVAMALCDYCVANMKKSQMMQSPMEPLPVPQKLPFNITPEVKKDIEEAKQHMDIMAQDIDLRAAVFDHFGKNVMKANKMSPDAFVQMAIQLAYYRMYQQCCSTMEPVSLRSFRLGRVAAIGSATTASAVFVKAFDDPKKQNSEKLDLLEKAVKVHRWLTNMAISGHNMPGHLYFLRMQAVEEKLSMPGIFTDTPIDKTIDCQISTSQITSKVGSLPCIGPEDPGTYDVCYSIMNDHIDLTVSTYEASDTGKKTNAPHLIRALEVALLDMRTLLEQTPRVTL